MFDTKKFGAYIAQERKNSGLTQSELADKLCLTRQAISKYELGDSFPDISILIQIAELFEITLDELVGSGSPTYGESKIIKSNINVDNIVNLAPLVRPSTLGAFASKLNNEGIDITPIVSIAQYLNDDDILQVINAAKCNALSEGLLEKIIPFLDMTSKEAILKKIIEGEIDWSLLKVLLPHIENMTPQLEAAILDGALPSETLEIMHEYFLRERIR